MCNLYQTGGEQGGGTVLLIDDDASFAQELATGLGTAWRFLWIDRSDAALELIRRERPRWILLDLQMPHQLARLDEGEGLAILHALTPEEVARVIVVTALLTEKARRDLGRFGRLPVYLKTERIGQLQDFLAQQEA